MADTVTTLALTVLAQEYRGDIVRQINRRCQFLRTIPIVRGGGKNVAWAAEKDGAVAENYSEGADTSNFGGDGQASAVLSWGLYRAPFHVSNLALDASRTASTPLGNHMRWARSLVNSTAELATTLNGLMYSGAGTGTTIAGLGVAIGDATNTYGTIDRAAGGNSYWQPYVVDPGLLTDPTFAQIRTDLGAIYDDCGEVPDVAFVPTAVFNKIASLFDANRRYVQEIQTARGNITLDAGYGALDVDGCMFMRDKDATPNLIHYVNTNHVSLEVLPPADVPDEAMQMVQADDGFGSVPMSFKYERLAKNGPSERAEVLATCQLKVDRPNTCGVRKNVAA